MYILSSPIYKADYEFDDFRNSSKLIFCFQVHDSVLKSAEHSSMDQLSSSPSSMMNDDAYETPIPKMHFTEAEIAAMDHSPREGTVHLKNCFCYTSVH